MDGPITPRICSLPHEAWALSPFSCYQDGPVGALWSQRTSLLVVETKINKQELSGDSTGHGGTKAEAALQLAGAAVGGAGAGLPCGRARLWWPFWPYPLGDWGSGFQAHGVLSVLPTATQTYTGAAGPLREICRVQCLETWAWLPQEAGAGGGKCPSNSDSRCSLPGSTSNPV